MQNNVGLFLAKRALLSPNVEGFVDADTGRRFTFAEWNRRANRTANFLSGLSLGRGDRVALLQMNSVEYMESFFALAKLGAVCVPLNWRLTPEELAFILRDSGSTTLVFGGEFVEAVAQLHARGRDEGGTVIERFVYCGKPEARPAWALDYDELQGAASEAEPPIGGAEEDELYIMYTSGTTGLPKGAVHTHDTATWGVLTVNSTSDLRYKDRYLVALPLFHVGALTPVTAAVHRGVTAVVMRAFDPKRAWELIDQERITTGLKVPAMLNFMLQVYDPERCRHEHLRWLMSGAAPVPVSLIEEYARLGIEIHQVYGLTESCGPACLISPDDALARAGSTGKAFFHTDVRVVDEGGEDVAPGEPGEVLIRGRHIMKGYWNRPDDTARTLRDGWLYSGDVATVDADGFVYIQDRIKDMYIAGGENVYPAEVEGVLMRHPKVLEAAVIGQSSTKWGELGAAVVVRKDPALTQDELVAFCQDKLARFKQPRNIYFVDEVPRNPSGKILKRLLRERFPGPAPE
ncbi:MAG TPA: long-chain fatty acid--CoA ligase [Thermoanaerobaculia bacterium]|nr:long-chain fatty acid--CoA ligase [Thermoanaerobaculia bacterium]